VRDIFEQFFSNQIANKSVSAPKRRRCGVCEACQLPECGTCSHCKDMIKFGGSGRSKQACVHRHCPYMAVQTAEEDEELEVGLKEEIRAAKKVSKKGKVEKKPELVQWVGPGEKHGNKTFYHSSIISSNKVGRLIEVWSP